MNAILRMAVNSSFIFSYYYFYLLSLLFLFSCRRYAIEEILSAPWRFDVKAARNTDKANSKIFQFKFASLPFIVARRLFWTKNLYVRQLVLQFKKNCFIAFCLEDIMCYFNVAFYDVRKQCSPNLRYFVKALINLHASANF